MVVGVDSGSGGGATGWGAASATAGDVSGVGTGVGLTLLLNLLDIFVATYILGFIYLALAGLCAEQSRAESASTG